LPLSAQFANVRAHRLAENTDGNLLTILAIFFWYLSVHVGKRRVHNYLCLLYDRHSKFMIQNFGQSRLKSGTGNALCAYLINPEDSGMHGR